MVKKSATDKVLLMGILIKGSAQGCTQLTVKENKYEFVTYV